MSKITINNACLKPSCYLQSTNQDKANTLADGRPSAGQLLFHCSPLTVSSYGKEQPRELAFLLFFHYFTGTLSFLYETKIMVNSSKRANNNLASHSEAPPSLTIEHIIIKKKIVVC